MSKSEKRAAQDPKPGEPPGIALTHGQTVWLMGELGLRQGVSASTFNYYIKSLRKLGIPFEKGKGQSEGHRHVTYDFEELMELTLALLLRVYGWLPDEVANGLRTFRDDLRGIYRLAYRDSVASVYPSACLSAEREESIRVEGLFLDLNIRYAAGHMIDFGPPRTVSPFEALHAYGTSQTPARAYLPLNVTAVARMIVGGSRDAPSIRRGRGTRMLHPS